MKLDLLVFGVALVLSVSGIALIYSAVVGTPINLLYIRQSAFLLLGIGAMLLFWRIPLRVHDGLAYIYYIIAVLLLVLVLLQTGNVKRWLGFGGLRIQPSEFSKLAMIFVLGRWFRDHLKQINSLKVIVGGAALVVIPFFLVIKEPDLGTGLVFWIIYFVMLLAAGIKPIVLFMILNPILAILCAFHWLAWTLYFVLLILIIIKFRIHIKLGFIILLIAIFFGAMTPYVWSRLHPYQRERIMVFLNPKHDPFGAGYQLLQSKIAVGSGGIFGKGYLKGTQTRLQFIPAKHSDFIFAVLGEQFGFIGAIALLILYLLLFWRALMLTRMTRTHFARMVVFAVAAVIIFQALLNISMCIGLAPITGIPLPFVSSGGSSLIVFWSMIGMLQNVYSQRVAQ
ncbi:rod shape-determining protein RodA [bacterium]|nr:rod shape-determining protein RodA [bacterium]